MILFLAGLGGLCLAFANGSNDNFKGVATLLGSRTAGYRRALAWGTLTTAAGSVAAIFFARGLMETFRGGGIVPPDTALDPTFAAAVACSAAATVLSASRIGMPVSTTHALIGSLVGTGLMAAGSVSWNTLTHKLLLPLCISPLVAFAAAGLAYKVLHSMRIRMGVERGSRSRGEHVSDEAYRGRVLGVQAEPGIALLHYISAGSVGFARGLNDTPKMAALLLVAPVFEPSAALLAVGAVIAGGAWFGARRVAETLAHRITSMNAGQGLTANAVTATVVIASSRLGLPASTTHVSCGALIGIGAAGHGAVWGTIRKIVLAWLVTMPIAGIGGALAYIALTAIA
ncbi:MAG: PiT family inorganic phosphate transporter [Chlamydiales bacterium]|jgi:PiT family inorganic phosphate transporter